MSGRDWHALSARLGPQRPPVKERELAPPVPASVCTRCGREMKVPALVTRKDALCGKCAAGEPEPEEPPLVCGKRIEELVWQATRLYERLKERRRIVTDWSEAELKLLRGWAKKKYTAEDLDRAIAAAYRRFWRRKRIWLTQ